MSTVIPDHFRKMFADNFRDTVQQTDSRLMKTVQVARGLTGVQKQIQFVLPTSSQEVTGQRHKKVTVQELETDARWYFAREFQTPTFESKFDEKKLAPAIMGNGKHLTAHQRAYLLDCDSVIMTAITGAAYTGINGGTTTNLGAANTVEVDWVALGGTAADSALTASKLIEGIRILSAFEAWNEDVAAMGEQLWCVIDAKEEANLRQQANKPNGDRLYSSDFGGIPVFSERGFLQRWGAINFVVYNGLPTATVDGASGNVSAKYVPLYTSTAVEFGVWSDFSATVDRRPDLSNSIQFLSQYSIGAGREQEKKVVLLECTV
jgi:hypothetical protein